MKMFIVFVFVIGLLAMAPILIRWIKRQLNIEDSAPGPAVRSSWSTR